MPWTRQGALPHRRYNTGRPAKTVLDSARTGLILGGRCRTQHLSRRIGSTTCCAGFRPTSTSTPWHVRLTRLSQLAPVSGNFAALAVSQVLDRLGATIAASPEHRLRCRPSPLRRGSAEGEISRHVSAPQASPQGRQAAPLLEHRREPPGVGRSDGAAACVVSGRDQRQSASGMVPAPSRRSTENRPDRRQIALFPEDRAGPGARVDVVHVKLSGLRLHRPRQWGACWLACELWDQLQLDDFWSPRLPPSRQGTRWLETSPEDAGDIPPDRPRQRVAAASAMV